MAPDESFGLSNAACIRLTFLPDRLKVFNPRYSKSSAAERLFQEDPAGF